ncbi:hypothetical protein QFC22_002624 [Naganishia vaughanmartiniae]|uniref:Uncharacterized protein n=1 Tax=Naganishia vaughanmartiniae TaxID=1424756 RepID=A0ACC2XAN2_9TREE|nr:hypothetical protein QFC22_002624 [Naganishia vaughanmartiniae]
MSSSSATLGQNAETLSGPSPVEDSAFESWRTSLSQLTGLGLTPDEKLARDARIAAEREAGDWTQCEKWKNSLMTRSAYEL